MNINLVHTMQLALLQHEERIREAVDAKPIPPSEPIDTDSGAEKSGHKPRPVARRVAWWLRSSER